MIDFTLICPTRKRKTLVTKFLNSVEENTKNISQLEVILIYDTDDTDRVDARPWVRIVERERGKNLSHDYFNWAFKEFARGNYIMACGDDMEFKTKDWDVIALEKMSKQEYGLGRVCCPHYDVPGEDSPFSYFPFYSRATINRLGYMMPERFGGWAADAVIDNIFRQNNLIIDLPVKVSHIGSRRLQDEAFRSMLEKTVASTTSDKPFDIMAEILKFR